MTMLATQPRTGQGVISSSKLYEYVPGTETPNVGDEFQGTFELTHGQHGEGWSYTEETLLGTTKFVVDKRSENRPSEEGQTWKFRVQRVFTDTPSVADSSLYFRLIFVNLIYTVKGTKKETAPKPDLNPKQASAPATTQVVVEKKRMLSNICFLESSPNTWTFNFMREDGVQELLQLECDQRPASARLKEQRMTVTYPLNVEVVRVIDDQPKFKKFAVRRV